MRVFVTGLLLLASAGVTVMTAESAPDGSTSGGYAVVVSAGTAAEEGWAEVVEVLVAKHGATVIRYTGSLEETLGPLRAQFPRQICFVTRPEETTAAFVREVHRLTRRLDDDPYVDCFWGILTGYDAANARRIAEHREPLVVRKVASGTELAMEMVEEGVWYCELTQHKMVRKERGAEAIEGCSPADTTQALVDTLNAYQADLFVTSGHATERDWMIGFRYKNGFFKHADGRLHGLDTQGERIPVGSPNPKVYLPVGNCLMGHIDRRDCMATAWMNSAGVKQMLGYIVPTWFGYMGWGVLDYFIEQPGRYTLTEAFFANHHALTHRLATWFPEWLEDPVPGRGRAGAAPALSEAARTAGLTPMDGRGLSFDRDVVAFYGDPAWEARMADRPRAFEQHLEVEGDMFTFEIHPRRGVDSFQPINTNGSQRGWRPFIAFLPHRVTGVKILEGADLEPVVTDDFILVPNPRACDPTRPYRVRFTAQRLR